MKKRFCLAAFFLFLLINFTQAQKFGVAAVAGVNLSQINGDKQLGYKKIGLTTGLRSIVNFNERWQLHAELLYSQRGAAPSDLRKITINLNYAETPIYLSYIVSDYESTGRLRLYAGASFGRLISYETKEIFKGSVGTNEDAELLYLQDVSTYFNENDLGLFAGVQWLPFDDHFGFELRQTFSANLLFDKNDVGRPIQNASLRSYFISIRLFYELNNVGDRKRHKRRRK